MIQTMLLRLLYILAGPAVLMTAQSAAAQVTVYKHCNFGGSNVSLGVGNYDLASLRSRGIQNDDISAIRVNRGYQVTLYEHAGFRGRSITLTSNASCLVNRNFNDVMSSMRISRRPATTPPRPAISQNERVCKNMVRNRVAWNRAGNKSWAAQNLTDLCRGTTSPNRTVACFKQGIRQHGSWQRGIRECKGSAPGYRPATTPADRPAPANSAVILYSDCNYRGNQTGLNTGNYDLNSLTARGMRNDDVSAIFVKSGYTATIYEHAGFRGRSRTFRGNDSCFVNDGFNDILSSVQVRRQATVTPPRPNPGGGQSSEIRRLRQENRELRDEIETLKATIKALLDN